MFNRLAALTCLLSLSGLTPGLALTPERALTQFQYDTWTSERGLPQNSVTAILQTRDGYLWVGTFEGLTRFDGVRFRVFDTTNTPQLHDNSVAKLLEDRAGRLLVAYRANGGLVRLHRDQVDRGWTTQDGLLSDVVWDVVEDRQGRLWVATEGGLNLIENETVRAIDDVPALAGQKINALALGEGQTIWVATKDGLLRLDGEQRRLYTVADGLSSNTIIAIEVAGSSLWVGTDHGTVDRLDGERFLPVLTAGQLQEGYVRALHLDRNGCLWVGTYGELGGISRLTADGRLSSFTVPLGLHSSFLRSITEDREGSIWFGSNAGLHRFRDGKFNRISELEGLGTDYSRVILEDRQGDIWIGSDGGGLARLEGGQAGLARLAGDQHSALHSIGALAKTSVRALAEQPDGGLWIGIWSRGLGHLVNGTLTLVTAADGLPNASIRALLVDRDGTLWIGSEDAGLLSYRDGVFTSHVEQGFPSDDVRVIFQDRSGRLWFGTADGLCGLHDGTWTMLTMADGLAANPVFALFEDERDDLWIGTQRGLSRLRDGRVTSFGVEQGMVEHAIFQILEDDDGLLWLSSNKGIFRVARAQLDGVAEGTETAVQLTRFGKADGMKIAQCNGTCQPSGCKSRDGRLWFPTPAGVLTMHPQQIRSNPLPPPVLVEEVVVDGQALRIEPGQVLTIEPGAQKIDLRYTGLSLLAPESVRFRYQLQGVDRAWVDAGSRRIAYYTNLEPGRYRFRVLAANHEGVWSPQPATCTLVLRPYFYQTRLFLLAVGVLLVSLAFLSYSLRSRSLTRRAEKLELLVAERTGELLAKNRELEDAWRQLAVANRKLERLSTMDGLTGLANRRRFDEQLELEWRRAFRTSSELALLMIDIDCFKGYNDRYGHQAGDDCLRSVAEALDQGLARAGDFLARYGGEEFVAVLPATTGTGAASVAERMRRRVEGLALVHEASTTAAVVTISVGLAVLDPLRSPEMAAPRQLIERADRALYRAKQEGRNRVLLDRS